MKRSIVLCWMAALALAGGVLVSVGAEPTVEAAPDYPLTEFTDFEYGPFDSFRTDDDGSTISLLRLGKLDILDVASGTLTPTPPGIMGPKFSAQPTGSGNHLFTVDRSTRGSTLVERFNVATGAIDSATLVYPYDDWQANGVRGADASGRYIALSAASGDIARSTMFIFDFETGEVLTDRICGITLTCAQTNVIHVSPDGNRFTYTETDFFPSRARYIEWNRAENSRRYVQRPADNQILNGWRVSPNLEWLSVTIDGALHVRNVASGAGGILPLPVDQIERFQLTNNGRVVFTATDPDPNRDARLLAWDGPGRPVRTVSPDIGGSTDIASFRASLDGTIVTFAVDIDPLQGESSDGDARLFQAQLPAVPSGLRPAPGFAMIPLPTDQRRIMDTRAWLTGDRISAQRSRCANAVAAENDEFVVVNVTVVRSDGAGFGTLHPTGRRAGDTASVNFTASEINPNLALTKVGGSGRFCFENGPGASIDLVIDHFLTADTTTFTEPTEDGAARLVDTREGVGATRFAPSQTQCVTPRGADPGDAVIVNIVPLRADGIGFATLHSSDDTAGETASVNYGVATIDPNLGFTEVGADGTVCLTNGPTASADVVIDQLLVAEPGTFTAPSDSGAVRVMETRQGVGGSVLIPGETRCVDAVNAEPGEFVVVNVVPVRGNGRGFGTVHSSDESAGGLANVNYDIGTIDPNVAITEVGADGRFCFTNSPATITDLVIDQLLTAPFDTFRPAG